MARDTATGSIQFDETVGAERSDRAVFFHRVLETTQNDTIVVEDDGTVVYASETITDVIVHPPDQLVGESLENFVGEELSTIVPDVGGRDRLDVSAWHATSEDVRLRVTVRTFEFAGQQLYAVSVLDGLVRETYETKVDRYEAITEIPV